MGYLILLCAKIPCNARLECFNKMIFDFSKEEKIIWYIYEVGDVVHGCNPWEGIGCKMQN